jgi:hypothetical protein
MDPMITTFWANTGGGLQSICGKTFEQEEL